MKKMIALLLSLCVLCVMSACGKKEEPAAATPTPANDASEAKPEKTAEESYDDQLATVFESGKAVLRKAEFQLPDPGACEIMMPPDSFWEYFDHVCSEEEIRSQIGENLRIISYSPDGSTAIGFILLEDKGVIAAVSGNRVTILYPTDQRGMGDLKQFLVVDYFGIASARPNSVNWLDYMGLIWSPDGRYVCPMSRYAMKQKSNTVGRQAAVQTVDSLQAISNPVKTVDAYAMIDTQTGEVFALESYPRPASADSARLGLWIWLDACFSPDGKSFYVLCRDDTHQKRILQYDTASWEQTEYMTGMEKERSILPGMTLLEDGRFFALTNRNAMVPVQKLVWLDMEGGVQETELSSLNEGLQAYGDFTCGSSRTGDALLFLYFVQGSELRSGSFITGLLRVHAGADGLTEPDTLWIGSAESRTLVPMTYAEIMEIQSATIREKDGREGVEEFRKNTAPYLYFRELQVSPGGRFALAVAENTGTGELVTMLIRLSDMASIPVDSAKEISRISPEAMKRRQLYGANIMNWSAAGILVNAEESMLYQLETGE